jgi:hypothetical protein
VRASAPTREVSLRLNTKNNAEVFLIEKWLLHFKEYMMLCVRNLMLSTWMDGVNAKRVTVQHLHGGAKVISHHRKHKKYQP